MRAILILVSTIMCLQFADADILELKDGSLVNGTYQGGSSGTIRFESSGQLGVYPVTSVLALTISRSTSAAPQPVAPPAQPIAPPAQPKVAPAASTSYVIPAGTDIPVQLRSEVSSRSARPGQKFEAILVGDLRTGSVIVAPKGTLVRGTVTEVRKPRRLVKVASLGLTLDELVVGNKTIRISSKTLKVETQPDGSIIRGAIAGAVIGEVVDDDAGHGAAAGASLGALKKGDDIAFGAGTILSFKLSSPIKSSP